MTNKEIYQNYDKISQSIKNIVALRSYEKEGTNKYKTYSRMLENMVEVQKFFVAEMEEIEREMLNSIAIELKENERLEEQKNEYMYYFQF